jgi:hypothetical protein
MDFYTPIFSKIVDSSLWSEPDYVVKVFLTLLAKKDRDQIVRGSAYNIACWAKKTEAEVMDALKLLAAPDTRRIEPQPHEGRRIERTPEGWLILNGLYYQNLMSTVNRRAYKAGKEKERRERKKLAGDDGKPVGAKFKDRERRYGKAMDAGDIAKADAIAAEGLK